MDFGKYIGGREDVMLDKRKIRLMTRAAIYEKNYGEEDFKISSYYKKDYSSLIHGSRLFGSQSVMDWPLQCCFSVGERLRWKASRLQSYLFLPRWR